VPHSPAAIGPVALCDLLLGASLAARVSCVTLEPCGEGHLLSLLRGAEVLRAIRVDDEAAAAAVVRLATAAGLDPLPEGDGAANVSRVRVRDRGGREAEVLVSLSARGSGFDVEARALLVDGREPVVAGRSALRRCDRCRAIQAGHLDRCELDDGELHDLADDPRVGGTIGPYRIESTLGVGGMGRVFGGLHALLGREVAIKVMHQTVKRATTAERRFLLEARATSRLRHPAIVEVLDFGVLSDGRPYMVMERLRGSSLVEALSDGPLPVNEALRIAIAIADALGAAHDAGVVHNDLKPSNVLLVKDERANGANGANAARRSSRPSLTSLTSPGKAEVPPGNPADVLKLIDFGAASLRESLDDDPHLVVGTPSYIAPERIQGVTGDPRSDLYSLGVVLYELIDGAPPFRSDRPKQVLSMHLNEEPPALISPHGALPRGAAHVVARALRKAPGERYQSAAEMRGDLERALAGAVRPSWRRWLP
jgi:serine/threonine-protein kinase